MVNHVASAEYSRPMPKRYSLSHKCPGKRFKAHLDTGGGLGLELSYHHSVT